MQNEELMVVETMFFILDLAIIGFAGLLFVFLLKNEKKRDKYEEARAMFEEAQKERENTILARTEAILLKMNQIESQKAKLTKEVLQIDNRLEQAEKDIKEIFRVLAKGNHV